MNLVGQARQYWTNIEKLMKLKNQGPIQTWDEIEDETLREMHVVIQTTLDQ